VDGHVENGHERKKETQEKGDRVKIPKDEAEQITFYNKTIENCFISREERKNFYSTMRMMYLFGSEVGLLKDGQINKIFPAIDLLSSFLYAQETTRFAMSFSKHASEMMMKYTATCNDAVNDEWLNSNADFIANEAVKWGLVYNTMIVKLVVRAPDIHAHLVTPHNFGVLREDLPTLDRQEACCVRYVINKSELETQLQSHPRKDAILSRVAASPANNTNDTKSPIERLLISAGPGTGSSNITGEVDNPTMYTFAYEPKVGSDMVEMYELYLYDDELHDYRIVTVAAPGVVVFDRAAAKAGWIKGELPFIKFTPNPLPDYFWGRSEVEALIGLQKRREWLTGMLQNMLSLACKPPKALTGDGWTGIQDEKYLALDEPNSFISNDNPTASVSSFAPSIPTDLWKEFGYNDEQFLEALGLSNVLMGKGEHGVRSQSQTKSLATLGSSRSKKRALVVEDSLEKMATLYAKCMRVYDPKSYRDDDGKEFVFQQIEDDFVVKVDAHSNSPLFMEDQHQMAELLLNTKSITRKRFLQLMNPPMLATLIDDLEKKIEPGEAQAAEKNRQTELAIEAAKHPEGAPTLTALMGGKK
jgi:hypothetical protein